MKLRGERGTVFVTTMVCLLLIVLTGSGAYQFSSGQIFAVNRMDRSLRAQSLAEAGLAKALSNLNTSFNGATNASYISSTSLGGGTYSVAINNYSSRVLVTSTGTYQSVTRKASAEVSPPTLSALDYALAAGGNLTWDPGTGGSSGTVTGDLYAGGNVSMDGTVNGDVDAGGTITGTNSGTQTTPAGVATFPTVTSSYYQTIAQANSLYYAGNKTFNSSSPIPATPAGGVIYVAGNVTINDTQATTACIFAGGNINIQKSGSSTPKVTINQYSNYPALVALGNITIDSTGNPGGGAYFIATGLIYAGGNFDIIGNHYDNPRVSITGSILARGNLTTSLTSHNNLLVTYVHQSPPGMNAGLSTMQIVSYNE